MAFFCSSNQEENGVYSAVAYYRLSKDGRKGLESDSIANQRKLILEYISKHPNIQLVKEAKDDGYTGTNYDRPGFQEVLDTIDSGKANCVIVKDLSRLGREYIETGKYLEMIFPAMGVRFIAINDDVDSENSRMGDDIIVPVKNIMNESYCRELSQKLRRQFKVQRSNGEFLGAFACYGYMKSAEDRHKLVVDEYASEIVRGIFVLKTKGYSQQAIADFLNREGVLPPAEYKKSQGLNFKSGLKRAGNGKWSAVSIRNILTNPIYMGTLVQGKRGTPNYKVKKIQVRDESEWTVIKNNHESIVDPQMFQCVQNILRRDTRTSPTEQTVFPLAGVVFCPDCHRPMCRRTVARGKKTFSYYVCSTHKKGQGCSSHSIEQKKLEEVVLRAVQNQVKLVVELDRLLSEVGEGNVIATKKRRLDLMIAEKNKEIDGYKEFRYKLYEALREELIDRDEYEKMRAKYAGLIESAQKAVEQMLDKRDNLLEDSATEDSWIMQFIRFDALQTLGREAVVALIDQIYVYPNKEVRIDFNFRNEFATYQGLLTEASKEVI